MARTHGKKHTPEYACWVTMRQRCSNPRNPVWHHYGGRGITVCERWQHSFENFLADMGQKPKESFFGRGRSAYSLDRIDNDGPYAPENCRWATYAMQENNRRYNQTITFQGVTKTRAEWEQHLGYPPELIKQRLKLGWSVERIMTTPRIATFHPQRRRRPQ